MLCDICKDDIVINLARRFAKYLNLFFISILVSLETNNFIRAYQIATRTLNETMDAIQNTAVDKFF